MTTTLLFFFRKFGTSGDGPTITGTWQDVNRIHANRDRVAMHADRQRVAAYADRQRIEVRG